MDYAFLTAFRDLQDSHQELLARVELLEEAMLADDDEDDDDSLVDVDD